MRKQRTVGFRKSGYTSHLPKIALIMAIFSIFLCIALAKIGKVHETYTERSLQIRDGRVIEQEYKKEITRPLTKKELDGLYSGVSLEIRKIVRTALSNPTTTTLEVKTAERAVVATREQVSTAIIKHFPESTYIKGAIMEHGEAGGIPSMTERSQPLWTACNRVDSDDPFYPDDLESVIEQAWQFDGYTPNGEYTKADYDLAVDVFERWYREKHGETNVGRTLPADYLFFTGDGVHNYFRKTQNGAIYVLDLPSPYEN